jgi:hypothetical protein
MNFQNYRKGITGLSMILAGSALVAQVNTGQLNGKVTDGKGHAVVGAKITVSSTNLQIPRTIITDAAGVWRAPLLMPGYYSINVTKNDFYAATIKDVRVGAGADIHQDIHLRSVETTGTTVEVVDALAVVDKTDTKTAINFSGDQLLQFTGGRSFNNAVDLSPGVSYGASGNPVIRGGQTSSTILSLNGQDIKDPLQNQVDGYYFIGDNVEDVQVVLSPLNARNGRTIGGAINVVTKSGSNEFEGSLRASPYHSGWYARNKGLHDPAGVSDGWNNSYDITLAGPIVKDRLWFSYGTTITPDSSSQSYMSGHDPIYNRASHAGPAASTDPTVLAINNLTDPATSPVLKAGNYVLPTWDSSKPYNSTTSVKFHQAKLTWALSENHKLQFFGSHQEWKQSEVASSAALFLKQNGPQKYMSQMWGANYDAILGTQTFMEVKVSRQKQWNRFIVGDAVTDPTHTSMDLRLDKQDANSYNYMGSPFGLGGGTLDQRNSTNGGVNFKLYRNAFGVDHDIDLGVDGFRSEISTSSMAGTLNESVRVGGIFTNGSDWIFPTLVYTGPNSWGQSGSGNSGLAPMMWKYYGKDGVAKNDNIGYYANDQITINKNWNVMVGMRLDHAVVKDTDGAQLVSANTLSPRFVLTYDINGDSSRIFKFNYSRMASDFPQSYTSSWLKTATQKSVQLPWSGIGNQPLPGTANDVVDGTQMYGLRYVTIAQLLDFNNYGKNGVKAMNFSDTSQNYVRDPNLKPMLNDEFALEFRRNWNTGSYLRMAYVYRKESKIWASQQEYDPAYWATLTDPTGSGLHSMYSQQTHVFNSSDLWRDYNSVELELNQKINTIFSWGLNYTYSRLRGNTDAGDGTNSFGDYGVPGYYQYRGYLKNVLHATDDQLSPNGALLNDVPHTGSIRASAVLPIGKGWISYTAMFKYSSGGDWSETYGSPINYGAPTGQSMADIHNAVNALGGPYAPSAPITWSKYYGPRGAYHNNDYYNLDLNIAFEVPVAGRVKAMGQFSIYNVLNRIVQTNYDTDLQDNPSGSTALFVKRDRFGTTPTNAVDNYGNYWSSPRSVGMSFGFKF